MKAFVDTNVIIDLLSRRVPFYIESQQLFSLADTEQIDLIVSSLSIVNTHYVLNDVMKLRNARSILRKFRVLVESQELNDKIIELSLNDDNFKDFEDGIQYYTALESKADIIITRNLKDFKHAKIPVMGPKDYLAYWKSRNKKIL